MLLEPWLQITDHASQFYCLTQDQLSAFQRIERYCRDTQIKPFYDLLLFFPTNSFFLPACLQFVFSPAGVAGRGRPTFGSCIHLHTPAVHSRQSTHLFSELKKKANNKQIKQVIHSHTQCVFVCCWPSRLWNLPAEFTNYWLGNFLFFHLFSAASSFSHQCFFLVYLKKKKIINKNLWPTSTISLYNYTRFDP